MKRNELKLKLNQSYNPSNFYKATQISQAGASLRSCGTSLAMEEAKEAPMESKSERRRMKQLWMIEDFPATQTKEARARWTKVGVAFENKDGSFALELAAIPVNGKLQMRDPLPPKLAAAV